jgi:manganese/zinc/iron transport system substrate-binding protein
MRRKAILGLLILTLGLAACGPASSGEPEDLSERQVRVVSTIGMINDIVVNVGGERVQAVSLMGPGIDPHLYKASEGDVARLQQADIIFYNGLHLESQMGEVLERMAGGRIRTVPVTENIDPTTLLTPPEFKGNHDPHVWFDVTLWMQAAERVRDTLAEADPASAALYQANAERYLGELAELHAYVLAQAERVPEAKRVVITAHDAFNYFGRAYGFEVIGLQGISTEAQASTSDVQGLANLITERQIPAVFVESSVPQRTIEAVQAAVRDRGFDVQIGGSLYSDAMGNPGTPEGTYIGMVRHNTDTIVTALLDEPAAGSADNVD